MEQNNENYFHPKAKKAIPRYCKCIYFVTVVSILLFLGFTQSTALADWMNFTVAASVRKGLATMTSWIPFSIAEELILLLPILVGASLCNFFANLFRRRSNRIFLSKILAFVCVVVILFVCTLAPGYFSSSLENKLQLERDKVSANDLYQTCLLLQMQMEKLLPQIQFPSESSSSVMPYSYEELNEKLMQAFDRLQGEYPELFSQFSSQFKAIMLSKPMTYTHISGVYSFFTGEANVNVYFPDYSLPFTAAHELAHQRGIAREEEANFTAFLVCLSSDDVYIQYSGLLNVYEYVASALASTSAELYLSAYLKADSKIMQEEAAFAAFFQPFRQSKAAEISNSVNNTYLQSMGSSEGTRSYDLVVDLTVAYFSPQFEK